MIEKQKMGRALAGDRPISAEVREQSFTVPPIIYDNAYLCQNRDTRITSVASLEDCGGTVPSDILFDRVAQCLRCAEHCLELGNPVSAADMLGEAARTWQMLVMSMPRPKS